MVTVDALNCQKDIAQTIIDRGADYVFALKGNHPQLHQEVIDWFEWATARHFRDIDHTFAQTVNKGPGRLEIRQGYALTGPGACQALAYYDAWAGRRCMALVYRQRPLADCIQSETAYGLSRLPAQAQRLLDATRAHGSVEHTFHWTLPVTFAQAASRLRLDNAPQNLAVVRHIAVNLLKPHPSTASLQRNRFRPALDHAFRWELLSHF